MPYKLNKIIFQKDNLQDYETHTRPLETEIGSYFKKMLKIEYQRRIIYTNTRSFNNNFICFSVLRLNNILTSKSSIF